MFDLAPPAANELEDSATANEETETEVKGHRRRKNRKIDWDKLRQIHHEHDLSDEEKICPCGRTMDRIGEDVTRELEYVPAKLEAHIHVRPKYACRDCKDGVSAAPLPPRPIPGGKRHRIEPWAYVRNLLLRLNADDPNLEDMLPDRWAASHPDAILTHRLEESRVKAVRTRARRAHRRARQK